MPLSINPCTVIDLVPQPQYFKLSSVVFDGIVTNVRHFDSGERQELSGRTLVSFKVSRGWKGKIRSNVEIHSLKLATECDASYSFEIGRRFIVYATKRNADDNFWGDQYPKGTKILILDQIDSNIERGSRPLSKAHKPVSN
jgi:hypothetical protein